MFLKFVRIRQKTRKTSLSLLGAIVVAILLSACSVSNLPKSKTGDRIWIKQYKKGGLADPVMNIDIKGNIYVAGSGPGIWNSSFIIIKYDSSGNQKWIRRHTGSSGSGNIVKHITSDNRGNVFVFGPHSGGYAAVKYNARGDRKWVRHFTSNYPNNTYKGNTAVPTLTLGPNSDVYITSAEGGIQKYDSNGNLQWTRQEEFGPRAMGIDSQGNVVVSGTFNGNNGNLTVKYDSQGNKKWSREHAVDGGSGYTMAVDSTGNIYVTGKDFTAKYDSNGITQWESTQSGGLVRFDPSGFAYIVGGSIVKYDSRGRQVWAADPMGALVDMVVDARGNVYITGATELDIEADDHSPYQQITAKLNAAGRKMWVRRYAGHFPKQPRRILPATIGSAIALGQRNDVVVTGSSNYFGPPLGGYATISYRR